MTGKCLGKIDFVKFGKVKDNEYLFGLQLGFTIGSCKVSSGAKYTINISPDCRWEKSERQEAITDIIDKINKILTDAKVYCISELIGKPVEVIIEDNTFKNFRILTEVL